MPDPAQSRKPLLGSVWVYSLYDVADEIDLKALRSILSLESPQREPSFRRPAPEYVRFQNAPVVENVGGPPLEAKARGRLRYYDYGVVSAELELPFEAHFDQLVILSSRWVGSAELERWTSAMVAARLEVAAAALIKPYARELWLNEDYTIVQIHEASDDDGRPLTAARMLLEHGPEIAQIVRGERVELSAGEQREVLESAISYYPNDLLVAAWGAALVYDTPDGAEPTLRILEYANSQLIEFRHYDERLTHVLAGVYKSLEHSGTFLSRWRKVSDAERLNTIRLDVTELAERTDNSIKFLSDMFYARAYRLAAGKVGVDDYRNLVDEKLRTAGELYEFMVNGFNHSRAFVLELLVVIILVIELGSLFIGKGR